MSLKIKLKNSIEKSQQKYVIRKVKLRVNHFLKSNKQRKI
jgi:hypothetical protein